MAMNGNDIPSVINGFTNTLVLSYEALGQAMDHALVDQYPWVAGDEESGAETFINGLEAGALTELGKDVADTSATLEKFTNALCNLVYKIDIDVRKYNSELVSMFVDSTEFGLWLERVKFDFNIMMDDPMYNLIPGKDYSKYDHTFYQPRVKSSMFTKSHSICIPISIQREEVKTAFHGVNEMNSFIAGIKNQIVNQTKYLLDTYAHINASAGICISNKVTNTAVHLITEAIDKGILSSGATPNDAMNNPNFMRYACERIANLYAYMKRPSTAFNNKTIPTWSNKVNLALLTDFANANIFRNQAITFNEQLVKFPEYDSVVAWQGVTSVHVTEDAEGDETFVYNTFDFTSLSTVAINDEFNELGLLAYHDELRNCVYLENAVGLLYDEKALGVTMFNEKTTSSYTGSADMTNTFSHIKLRATIDPDYNMIAIMLD